MVDELRLHVASSSVCYTASSALHSALDGHAGAADCTLWLCSLSLGHPAESRSQNGQQLSAVSLPLPE
eukprot:SAG22_NODE_20818_length_262_cov_0.944785_1_plen_67_part_01